MMPGRQGHDSENSGSSSLLDRMRGMVSQHRNSNSANRPIDLTNVRGDNEERSPQQHQIVTDIEDDDESYVPESLASFVAEASSTLEATHRDFFELESQITSRPAVGSTDLERNDLGNLTQSIIIEDEDDDKITGEILDRFDPGSAVTDAEKESSFSPDIFASPPPNPVASMTESQIKKEVQSSYTPSPFSDFDGSAFTSPPPGAAAMAKNYSKVDDITPIISNTRQSMKSDPFAGLVSLQQQPPSAKQPSASLPSLSNGRGAPPAPTTNNTSNVNFSSFNPLKTSSNDMKPIGSDVAASKPTVLSGMGPVVPLSSENRPNASSLSKPHGSSDPIQQQLEIKKSLAPKKESNDPFEFLSASVENKEEFLKVEAIASAGQGELDPTKELDDLLQQGQGDGLDNTLTLADDTVMKESTEGRSSIPASDVATGTLKEDESLVDLTELTGEKSLSTATPFQIKTDPKYIGDVDETSPSPLSMSSPSKAAKAITFAEMSPARASSPAYGLAPTPEIPTLSSRLISDAQKIGASPPTPASSTMTGPDPPSQKAIAQESPTTKDHVAKVAAATSKLTPALSNPTHSSQQSQRPVPKLSLEDIVNESTKPVQKTPLASPSPLTMGSCFSDDSPEKTAVESKQTDEAHALSTNVEKSSDGNAMPDKDATNQPPDRKSLSPLSMPSTLDQKTPSNKNEVKSTPISAKSTPPRFSPPSSAPKSNSKVRFTASTADRLSKPKSPPRVSKDMPESSKKSGVVLRSSPKQAKSLALPGPPKSDKKMALSSSKVVRATPKVVKTTPTAVRSTPASLRSTPPRFSPPPSAPKSNRTIVFKPETAERLSKPRSPPPSARVANGTPALKKSTVRFTPESAERLTKRKTPPPPPPPRSNDSKSGILKQRLSSGKIESEDRLAKRKSPHSTSSLVSSSKKPNVRFTAASAERLFRGSSKPKVDKSNETPSVSIQEQHLEVRKKVDTRCTASTLDRLTRPTVASSMATAVVEEQNETQNMEVATPSSDNEDVEAATKKVEVRFTPASLDRLMKPTVASLHAHSNDFHADETPNSRVLSTPERGVSSKKDAHSEPRSTSSSLNRLLKPTSAFLAHLPDDALVRSKLDKAAEPEKPKQTREEALAQRIKLAASTPRFSSDTADRLSRPTEAWKQNHSSVQSSSTPSRHATLRSAVTNHSVQVSKQSNPLGNSSMLERKRLDQVDSHANNDTPSSPDKAFEVCAPKDGEKDEKITGDDVATHDDVSEPSSTLLQPTVASKSAKISASSRNDINEQRDKGIQQNHKVTRPSSHLTQPTAASVAKATSPTMHAENQSITGKVLSGVSDRLLKPTAASHAAAFAGDVNDRLRERSREVTTHIKKSAPPTNSRVGSHNLRRTVEEGIAKARQRAQQRQLEKQKLVVGLENVDLVAPGHRRTGSRGSSKSSGKRAMTVPKTPSFATTAKYGKRPVTHKNEGTLAEISNSFGKGLRSDDCKSVSSASSTQRSLTIPTGPTFATDLRHGSHERPPRQTQTEVSLAQSTDVLKHELRAPYNPIKRKPGPTIPESPKFHKIQPRQLPKSTEERQLEEMSKLQKFKARPCPSSTYSGARRKTSTPLANGSVPSFMKPTEGFKVRSHDTPKLAKTVVQKPKTAPRSKLTTQDNKEPKPFKARPPPITTYRPQSLAPPKKSPTTPTKPFELATEAREGKHASMSEASWQRAERLAKEREEQMNRHQMQQVEAQRKKHEEEMQRKEAESQRLISKLKPHTIPSEKKVTKQTPFKLASMERHQVYEEERRRKLMEEDIERRQQMQFHAVPLPETTFVHKPISPQRSELVNSSSP